MTEIWKDVVGYEGLYQVSNLGNVRSVEREIKTKRGTRKYKGRIRKTTKKEDGYELMYLSNSGNPTPFYVHRLVAEAFVPNPDNKKEVDHIIPISKGGTNEAINLRWCTRQENTNNPISIDNYSKANKGKYGKEYHRTKPILQYAKDGTFIKEWECAADVYRELGINQSSISECARGKRYKSAGGYIWKYKEEAV